MPSKVSQAIGSVPFLKSYASSFSENDPNYYAIAKLFIQNNMLASLGGSHFEVQFKNKPLKNSNERDNVGSLPLLMDYNQTNIDFIAYADVQKQTQRYELSKPESGSAIYPLAAIINENELATMKKATGGYSINSLQLVVGDLVRNGKNLNSWMEVLTKLTEMVANKMVGQQSPFSFLATAIGTHDFADVDKGFLTFYNTVPTYDYLFDGPFEPELMLYAPQYQVEKTNLWFDVGRVRFIHLPYTTEEEITPMPDGFSDPIAFIKHGAGEVNSLGYGFEFNPHAIFEQFNRDLGLAVQARNNNKIDFIIVYGHAPLAAAPQFNHLHPGLFNSLITGQIITPNKLRFAKELLPALAAANVDLYLSGHNHQYDHCTISYNCINPATGAPVEWVLNAVTIGLGTELRSATKNMQPPQLSNDNHTLTIKSIRFLSGSDAAMYREYFQNKFLPAYLKCKVRGKQLKCGLMAKGGILRNKSPERPLDEAFDIFEITSHNK